MAEKKRRGSDKPKIKPPLMKRGRKAGGKNSVLKHTLLKTKMYSLRLPGYLLAKLQSEPAVQAAVLVELLCGHYGLPLPKDFKGLPPEVVERLMTEI